MANSREKALLALYDIEYRDTYSNMAVKDALSHDMSAQDKAFLTQLVYGVTRYKLTLDYIISKFSSVKIKKMSKYVLLILRMGVYQMIYLDKVPDSAVVNESVKLATRYANKSKGFINAVLRAVAKDKENIEFPKEKNDFLSVKYSFPIEMIELLSDVDGLEELLEALNNEPKTTVRINTLKTVNTDAYEISPLYEFAGILKGVDIASSNGYKNGEFIPQDVAAMMASLALSPKPNEFCIDVCAAPGGKTTHLAELMKNQGKVLAFDVHEHKVDIIKKNADRMGITIIDSMCHDSREEVAELLGKADKVLVDAPCSGLGIIRRKPDIKWHKEDIFKLPKIQMQILETSAKYLKVGGELVYSTCTILKRENEDIIKTFVENHPQFKLERIEIPSPLMRENDGYITFYPNIDKTDGFFISKIKRCE